MLKGKHDFSGFSSCRFRAETLARQLTSKLWPCTWGSSSSPPTHRKEEEDEFFDAPPTPTEENGLVVSSFLHENADIFYDVSNGHEENYQASGKREDQEPLWGPSSGFALSHTTCVGHDLDFSSSRMLDALEKEPAASLESRKQNRSEKQSTECKEYISPKDTYNSLSSEDPHINSSLKQKHKESLSLTESHFSKNTFLDNSLEDQCVHKCDTNVESNLSDSESNYSLTNGKSVTGMPEEQSSVSYCSHMPLKNTAHCTTDINSIDESKLRYDFVLTDNEPENDILEVHIIFDDSESSTSSLLFKANSPCKEFLEHNLINNPSASILSKELTESKEDNYNKDISSQSGDILADQGTLAGHENDLAHEIIKEQSVIHGSSVLTSCQLNQKDLVPHNTNQFSCSERIGTESSNIQHTTQPDILKQSQYHCSFNDTIQKNSVQIISEMSLNSTEASNFNPDPQENTDRDNRETDKIFNVHTSEQSDIDEIPKSNESEFSNYVIPATEESLELNVSTDDSLRNITTNSSVDGCSQQLVCEEFSTVKIEEDKYVDVPLNDSSQADSKLSTESKNTQDTFFEIKADLTYPKIDVVPATPPSMRKAPPEDSEDERPQLLRSTSLKTGKTPPGTPSKKKMVRFADVLGLDLEDVRHIMTSDLPHIPASAFAHLRLMDCEPNAPRSSHNSTVSSGSRVTTRIPRTRSRGDISSVFEVTPLPNDFWNASPESPTSPWSTLQGTTGPNTLQLQFEVPGQSPGFMSRVQEQGICLENVVVLEQTVRCTCRVMNWGYEKKVSARYTIDNWKSHNNIDAAYVPCSSDGRTDSFAFSIFLSPQQSGLRFAIKFSVNGKEYWDNNRGSDYRLSHQGNVSQSSTVATDSTFLGHFW